MKRNHHLPCLLTILLFQFSVLHSQTNIYHPFPETNAIWGGHYWPGMIKCGEHYSYTIAGDTVIGNQTYHQLSIPYVDSYGPCTVNHSAGYNGCYRQDVAARKVYYIAPGDVTEELLYDFTLEVGDTIHEFSRFNCTQPTDTISLIDSMLIGTNYRKVWHFGEFPISNTIIEGIGYVSGILEGCATSMPDGPFYVLDCFQQNGITLYPDAATPCQLVNSVDEPSMASIQLTFYPNPFSSSATLQFNRSVVNATITIYNCVGQQIRQIKNISGKTIILNRDNLSVGLYYISICEKGKLPATNVLEVID